MHKKLSNKEKNQIVRQIISILKRKGGMLKRADFDRNLTAEFPKLSKSNIRELIKFGLIKRKFYKIPRKGYFLSKRRGFLKGFKKEKGLYPIIAQWFENNYSPCITSIRKGKEWGMPDVTVIHERATDIDFLEDLEVIVIEIKKGKIGPGDLSQAKRYSMVAHKAYLASTWDELENYADKAEEFGVGLLKIKGKMVEEIVKASRGEPNRVTLVRHINKVFSLAPCIYCGCYFHTIKGETKIIKRKSFIHENGGRDIIRYICNDCANTFFPLLEETYR